MKLQLNQENAYSRMYVTGGVCRAKGAGDGPFLQHIMHM